MKADYQDFMIFFTFLLFWVSIQFGELVEDSIAYIMVLSLGIIHGANDLAILKKRENNSKKFVRSIFGYLILIGICLISFFVNPFISLLLFILISAYHFGEQHLELKVAGEQWIKSGIYLSYGLVIFSLIFIENLNDVDAIVFDLTGQQFSKEVVLGSLIFSSAVMTILLLVMYLKERKLNFNLIKEIFYLLALYLVFKTTSLILGFAIYFIFWHSIPSIIDQTKFLSGMLNKKNLFNYFKTAGIIWLISIAGLVLTYVFLEESLFSSVIFLLLFAVTAPHAWVMYHMKKSS